MALSSVRVKMLRALEGTPKNETGRSSGGFSTKIHVAVDMKVRPIHILVTPGQQQHDSTVAEKRIDYVPAAAVPADKAYDAGRIIDELKYRGMEPVIPPSTSRKIKRRYDRGLYKQRYLVECFFHSRKRWRHIATRHEKTATSYLGLLHLACAMLWLQ